VEGERRPCIGEDALLATTGGGKRGWVAEPWMEDSDGC
jgi:hypothetical protein